jgi:hypothetical protein
MGKTYTLEDLVSFGTYLLSGNRGKRAADDLVWQEDLMEWEGMWEELWDVEYLPVGLHKRFKDVNIGEWQKGLGMEINEKDFYVGGDINHLGQK